MSWHYTSAGQQVGPVEEAKLQELFQEGAVGPETLVWRAGMDGWKPYSVVFMGAQPSVQYGGFWIRVVAAIIDAIILSIAGWIVQAPLMLAMGGPAILQTPNFGPGDRPSPEMIASIMGMVGLSSIINLVLTGVYHVLFVALKGATPGKMAVGLKVVRADRQPLGMGLALGRWVASWISCITLFIGFIIAAFDAQKRTLHDHICGTRVVRTRA